MKLYWSIPATLKSYYKEELRAYKLELLAGQLAGAWRHLERAHIIGQAYPLEHTLAHWEMLKFGIRIKNAKEIIGQIPRLLIGGVKSFVGRIPVGNTGGTNVSPLKPMEIPTDLQLILDHANEQR